jgi:translation initiation factor 1
MKDVLVYSSETGKVGKKPAKKGSSHQPASGPCKMRLEKKGRGGKAVTVLFNLPFGEVEARSRMKALQSKLGCGASFKDGTIEFQGDVREKVQEFFVALGEKIVSAGG